MFTRIASGRIRASSAAPISLCVPAFSGACSDTTSARASSSSSADDLRARRARRRRVGDQQPHGEAGEPAADRAADRAVADQADGRAVEVPRRQRAAARPLAAPHRSVVLAQPPQRGQDQRDRVVRGGLLVRARRDGHDDAGRGRGLEVDRVGPDADPRDDAQPRRGGEHAGVERVGADDRGDRVSRQPRDLVRVAGARLRLQPRAQARPPAAGRRCPGPPPDSPPRSRAPHPRPGVPDSASATASAYSRR